jgi:phosphopantothenoylcysteine synthetase/decarboxylase
MKCIVTAGPTYEELDHVRRLTNFSTGALGTELANHLTGQGHQVTLLRGHYSTCGLAPQTPDFQTFTTTEDLYHRLKGRAADDVAAVFHAAAVSDFGFGKIWRRDEDGRLTEIKSRKFSTRDGTILAELTPTPKLIERLRGWFPQARLTGWKYEVEGDRARAIARAQRQVEESQTDACVANGPAYGKGFGLVEGPSRHRHLPDKPALFAALAEFRQK